MKTIGVTKFKEQCLALLDQLDSEGLVVTKHGKPVARVIPYDNQDAELIGSLRDKIAVRGNIFTTGIRWNADAES
ncbi:MAG: type II toxin-antitoxin system Phd/YefM family antitoxin [Dehalococcoidia bacterium]|nr:type II toxin-antitoxin system Phd/YefM family antitoxin [Dehalococcoidia bacterium]